MSKILSAQMRIDDIYLLRDLEEAEILDYVKTILAKEIAELIVNNEDIAILRKEDSPYEHIQKFIMSVTTVDHHKYTELSSAIRLLNLKYIDTDGNTIYLKDLL